MVRHYVRKRTFSTTERVLVHLSSEALRPEERTQEGIAAATRSARPTLTKWLDRMERRGLVSHARVRVDGHPLLKYAYRLSESGWRLASTLRKRLASEVVQVRAPTLGELSVRISEVPSLASARVNLTAAVAAVRKGKLDLTRASRPAREQGRLVWGGGLRRVDRFFGRAEELRDLDRWWTSTSRAILVTGLAGIGKTALVAAWVQGRRLGVPTYGFEIHRSSTAAGLLADFGAFLAALGKPSLATHLAQGVPLDAAFLTRLLERELRGGCVLLVIDNVDQATHHVNRFLDEGFLKSADRLPIRMILVGRRIPRWVEPSTDRGARVVVRPIRGLDETASKALLGSRGVRPDSLGAGEIVRKTRGHPLLLHLAATSGSQHGSAGQQYLEGEVWESLSPAERSVLEAASVFRKPVTERILEQVAEADHRRLDALVGRSLLEQTVSGAYGMHDVVRDFVARGLPDERRRRFHARAAGIFLAGTDPHDRWEGVYHLIGAHRAAQAAAILDREGASLLNSVAAEDIMPLVRSIVLDESDSRTYCSFAEVIGDSLQIRGHVEPALFQYGHARRLAETSGQVDRIPRLLRKMGFLERCRNHYSKALGYLVEAHGRLAHADNSQEGAQVLRELALVEQATGNLPSAAAYLNQAVDLATEAADRAALSRALLALASLETRMGNPERGLDYSTEGLRLAERSGNLTEIARANIVMGTSLQETGRLPESLRHHETGLRIAGLLGNLRLTAYATLNRAGALISLGRFKEAGAALKDASGLFGILEERDATALLKTYEGQLDIGLGHWTRAKEALDEGIRQLRNYGSPADLLFALKEIGMFYANHGELAVGRQRLEEARKIALKLRSMKLVAEIESALSTLGTPTGQTRVL